MMYSYNWKHVLIGLLFVRMSQALIVYFAPGEFDISSTILFNQYASKSKYDTITTKILQRLAAWDSVYFLKLVMEGISYEHEWVFCPLWWRVMRVVKIKFNLDVYDVLLAFIIINNIVTIGICRVTYALSYKVLNDSRFAYIASMLILVQPSGIFSTISYSEPIVQLLCYSGLYLWYSRDRNIHNHLEYFLSGLLFSVAFAIRSNSLLYGILYLYDFVFQKSVKDRILALLTGSTLALTLAYMTYLPYSLYCPERGEWCNSWSKSLVSYAQTKYWGNGFLRYFEAKNIPLFLIAAPQLILISLSLIKFKSVTSIRPIWIVSSVYLFLQFTTMHVQIVNRVSSFIPLHIWYVAHLLATDKEAGKWWVRWWIVWISVQTALFAMFLPPA
ncbi:hypothetical protein CANINC_002228 [Pichia inconspicua]|uniref:GPI mannosyltransferase 2 n=1 Tax=Pichia inconspicua TaxID=52247 RepID=A0A4T0X1U5_9ASCO|nr:hypothetical protein CANINC_002228 [[Candida] inconspicua]